MTKHSVSPRSSRTGLRLVIGFCLLTAILIGLGWLALSDMVKAKTRMDDAVDTHWGKVRVSREAMRYSSLNNRLTMQIFLLKEADPIEQLLAERSRNSDRIAGLIRQIESGLESAEEKQLLDAIRAARAPYVESYQHALRLLLEEGRPEEARRTMVTVTLPRLLTYHAAWEAFVQFQGEQMEAASAEVKAGFLATRHRVFSLLGLGVPLAIGIACFVTLSVVRQEDALRRYAEALQASQAQLKLQLDHMPIACVTWDDRQRVSSWNPAAQNLFGYTAQEALHLEWSALFPPGAPPPAAAGSLPGPGAEACAVKECRTNAGRTIWCEWTNTTLRGPDRQAIGVLSMIQDVTERKRAEADLKRAQGELLSASRLAGMGEMATSVLHNVGNVLNSLNTSATLMADRLKSSKINNIGRVAALMREHAADLGEFMTRDPKGKQLPGFLDQLGEHFNAEQAALLQEMDQVRQSVEHIKEIVTLQQDYARVSGANEPVSVASLVEDALRMNTSALARHDVQVAREYDPELPAVLLDKHKVLQILMNLIRNAKYACDESGRPDKRLMLRVAGGDGRVRVSVIDNGVGIPAENLERIFSRGFTTRKTGHGFGLHSGISAAREMGGSLEAHSEGAGKGATFTLTLPLKTNGPPS